MHIGAAGHPLAPWVSHLRRPREPLLTHCSPHQHHDPQPHYVTSTGGEPDLAGQDYQQIPPERGTYEIDSESTASVCVLDYENLIQTFLHGHQNAEI